MQEWRWRPSSGQLPAPHARYHSLNYVRGPTTNERQHEEEVSQGRSGAGLDWDGRDGRGHGVPVLGGDGYEYVR